MIILVMVVITVIIMTAKIIIIFIKINLIVVKLLAIVSCRLSAVGRVIQEDGDDGAASCCFLHQQRSRATMKGRVAGGGEVTPGEISEGGKTVISLIPRT